MNRRVLLTVAALAAISARSQAQVVVAGRGSTVQGDYLRGLGVAAWGMGEYNRNTAIANKINTETAIEVNEYFRYLRGECARQYAAMAKKQSEWHAKNFNAVRDRIEKNPNQSDVMSGEALNAILRNMGSGGVNSAELRSASVTLPIDAVRNIAFAVGRDGVAVSTARMKHKGKAGWPVAFQDERFAADKRRYDRALNNLLGEFLDGKVQEKSLDALVSAINDLSKTLEKIKATKQEDNDYKEGVWHIGELKRLSNQFRSQTTQKARIALETYSGTSTEDLRSFMVTYNLTFAPAHDRSPEERRAMVQLYEAFKMHRELLQKRSGRGGGEG